jgi:Fungal specific transcription factor domain.
VADRIESDKSCDAYFFLQKCRELSSAIASTRVPSKTPLQLGHSIPAQATARPLVEAYFRTFESVYRILHAPTFWQEYREYWQNPPAASPSFVVQLQLCMAIGTCFQDDVIRLRHLASQWIYEAKFWLATSSDKSKVSITTLQTMCLLHLAKETCGIGGNLSWVSAGSLLQTAMFLGLHRDPDNLPRMSPLKAELRRRLWATVLEIVLQSSLDTGAPPLLTLSDFDTRSPSNYDDEQLLDYDEPPPSPKPPNVFTHSTVQVALLRSFPVRLSIAQYVNHFNSSATYQTTLKWNTELTNACRALQATFQPFYDPAGILPKRLSLFQLRLAEHMVHRFFLALNHPWLWSAHNDSAYYFSRKMCVETSLKLYRAIATGSPAGDSGTASPTDDFTRLATCGYGPFRSAPTLAVLTLCLELLWQVQEDRPFRQSLGIDHQQPERLGAGNESDVNSSVGIGIGSGAAPRHDLLEAVKYSIGWTQRRIRNGETNIKAHLLYTALLVQIQALQRGVSDVEVERQVFGAVSEELNRCWHLLKDVAASIGVIPPSNGAPSLLDGPNSGGWSALGTGWFASSKSVSVFVSSYLTPLGRYAESRWLQGAVRGFHSIFDIHDADFFIGT